MIPEEQFTVHQCTKFSADTKLPHEQGVKCVLKCLKGKAMQGIVLKPNPEKGIKCYVDTDFYGIRNCSIPGSLYTARLSSLAVNDRTWAFE